MTDTVGKNSPIMKCQKCPPKRITDTKQHLCERCYREMLQEAEGLEGPECRECGRPCGDDGLCDECAGLGVHGGEEHPPADEDFFDFEVTISTT